MEPFIDFAISSVFFVKMPLNKIKFQIIKTNNAQGTVVINSSFERIYVSES